MFSIVLISAAGNAAELDVAPIGAHFPLFTFEKSFNPQNALIAFTRLDESCHFVERDANRIVDFYWFNSGKERK
ncbi:MAG: hypothetical protein V4692_08415, partial [Bdellovibrionota bacterium]